MLFKALPLLQEGPGSFEIIKAEQTISNNTGSPMIVLLLKIWDQAGLQGLANEWLTENNIYRARVILRAGGMDIPSGNKEVEWTSDDFMGKKGRCEIGIEVSKNCEYPDKNKVKKYIKADSSTEPYSHSLKAKIEEEVKPFIDDEDVPF